MRETPRACKTVADFEIGERFCRTYKITDADLENFAQLSGDWNPVHFDSEYAANTMFGQRIAHGMISVAKFSGIFGMDFPGLGTLWEMQEVKFCGPVYLDRPYLAVAQVVEKERRRVIMETWAEDQQGHRVLEGRASVIPISEIARSRLKGLPTATT